MERQVIEISWTSLWRVLAVGLFVTVLYITREAVATLFLALVLSSALHPAVNRLEEWRIPRILGTIIIFLIGLTIIAFIIYTIVPLVTLELNSLFKSFNSFANQFLGTKPTSFQLVNVLTPNLNQLTNVLISGKIPFLEVLGRLLGGAVLVLATLALSFYLTISRSGVERFLRTVFPTSMEERMVGLYRRTSKKIGRWLQAQILLSLIIGTIVFIGLLLLGVEQALVLSVIAALFELVPIAGPIFAGGLAVLVAAGTSWKLALYVLIFFVAVQQIEGHVIVPNVMKKAIGVHPVIVLIALLGGAKIAGLMGVLLAVPVVVFLQEVVVDWVAIKRKNAA